jgi:hypothetical protein
MTRVYIPIASLLADDGDDGGTDCAAWNAMLTPWASARDYAAALVTQECLTGRVVGFSSKADADHMDVCIHNPPLGRLIPFPGPPSTRDLLVTTNGYGWSAFVVSAMTILQRWLAVLARHPDYGRRPWLARLWAVATAAAASGTVVGDVMFDTARGRTLPLTTLLTRAVLSTRDRTPMLDGAGADDRALQRTPLRRDWMQDYGNRVVKRVRYHANGYQAYIHSNGDPLDREEPPSPFDTLITYEGKLTPVAALRDDGSEDPPYLVGVLAGVVLLDPSPPLSRSKSGSRSAKRKRVGQGGAPSAKRRRQTKQQQQYQQLAPPPPLPVLTGGDDDDGGYASEDPVAPEFQEYDATRGNDGQLLPRAARERVRPTRRNETRTGTILRQEAAQLLKLRAEEVAALAGVTNPDPYASDGDGSFSVDDQGNVILDD